MLKTIYYTRFYELKFRIKHALEYIFFFNVTRYIFQNFPILIKIHLGHFIALKNIFLHTFCSYDTIFYNTSYSTELHYLIHCNIDKILYYNSHKIASSYMRNISKIFI